jgi:hypothetical protein
MIKKPILPSSVNLFIFIIVPVITFMLSLIVWDVISCAIHERKKGHILKEKKCCKEMSKEAPFPTLVSFCPYI